MNMLDILKMFTKLLFIKGKIGKISISGNDFYAEFQDIRWHFQKFRN